MNNINKGNEIRLRSIEQHTTPHIDLLLLLLYCVYVKWIISLIDIADNNNNNNNTE